ncbi:MAG: ADP-ribosylation factor-like protein [Candidatus Hodarchaeota archaeon]
MSEYVQLPERSLLGKKIVLCGLSEAGKTSIRDVVFGGKEATEVEGYGATLNYVRQFISLGDQKFTLMDLGGQRIFLDRFITKFSPFVFHNVAALIYVVDVADSDRFSSAKHYFDAALERLTKYSQKSNVFVLIHKMDLVAKNPNKDYIIEHLRSLFEKEINRKIIFFETTIYNETIKDALYEILNISFPSIPTRTIQPQREMPSTAAQYEAVSEVSPIPIETPQPIGTKQQIGIKAAPSLPPKTQQEPLVEVNLSEIVKALAFVEHPYEIPHRSEPDVGEAIPVSSQPLVTTEELTDESEIVKALQFHETGESSPEEVFQPPKLLEETAEIPELPTEELGIPRDEIKTIEIAISEILSKDEIKKLISDLEDYTQPQAAPKKITFPKTAFESHISLDDEFDAFIAAEELVKFLDETRKLFNIAYITVKMNDGENLIHVGDYVKYDELASTGFEVFQLQMEDHAQIDRVILGSEIFFLLVEPIDESLTMIVIGPSISKVSLFSKISDFKERVVKMINTTFSDIY